MTGNHWHITLLKGEKIKSDFIFSDRHKSILSYLTTCDQMFNGYIKRLGWSDVESGMLEQSEYGETDYLFCAIQSPYIMLWIPCDDCKGFSLN